MDRQPSRKSPANSTPRFLKIEKHPEIAKELQLEKWGFIFHCMSDESICEGYNLAIAFRRTKTLMDHNEYCDHFYYYRQPSNNA
jgi:hypothetical protein